MSEVTITVHPFLMGTDKEAANKVLEEASEAREAAEKVRKCEDDAGSYACAHKAYPYSPQIDCPLYIDLADEIADTIQAACNIADRYGIDLPAAMERCEKRNRARGRYGRETGVKEDE